MKILITRKIQGTRIGREVREMLEAFDVEVMETELCQRVAYIDAIQFGVSVIQYSASSKAAQEIEALCDELLSAFEPKSELEPEPLWRKFMEV